MKKDVIYIDIEDDVTSVIDKLKNTKEKIVALVPPKGSAVLQSVVNLKLIKRAASSAGKQPVIVTSNQALTALAGGLELYVAKNLQSKPVLASSLANDTPEDEEVEVSDEGIERDAERVVSGDVDVDDDLELSKEELEELEASSGSPAAEVAAKSKRPKKSGKKGKVPNFDSFRKRLLIIGGGIVLLIVILLAVFGRAKSDITVRAQTTPVDIAFDAVFNANASGSDPATFNLKANSQEKKQTLSQSFTPTGQKDIGEKASGKIKFTKNSPGDITVAAGTRLTSSNGLVFTVDAAVSVPGAQLSFSCPGYLCPGTATANVSAVEGGTRHNGASGAATGAPNGVTASFTGATSGGTSQVVKVVTQADVDKAKEALSQQDTNAAREELKNAFSDDMKVLDDTFSVNFGGVNSEPAVDQQANEAKLTAEVTYSLLAVSKKDLGSALDTFVTSKMTNSEQQRVYQNGLKDVRLEKVSGDTRAATFKVAATGYYGPQFDTEKLKEQVAGKKFGEARAYLQDLPGVKGVDMNLSPFWARKLPNVNRINIKLDVDTVSGS